MSFHFHRQILVKSLSAKVLLLLCILLPIIPSIHGEKGECVLIPTTSEEPGLLCTGYTTIPIDIPEPSQVRILLMHENNYLGTIYEGQLFRSNLTNLDILNIGNCHIQEVLRGAFRGGDKITELTLTGNRIESLDPYVFTDLPNLEKLFLGNNPLHNFAISQEFPSLKLKLLSLSDCGIKTISPNLLKNLKELNELYLYSNKLTTLEWEVLQPLQNLGWISLHNNPLNCDCKISFLKSYLAKFKIQLYSPENITCASAPDSNSNVIGKNWEELQLNWLVCPPQVSEFTLDEPHDDMLQFTCVYCGYPTPELKWVKDGNIIIMPESRSNERPSIEIETEAPPATTEEERRFNFEFQQHLLIKGFDTKKHGGNYSCVVSSSAGIANKTLVLNFSKDGELIVMMPSSSSSSSPSASQEKFPFQGKRSTNKPSSVLPIASVSCTPTWVVVALSIAVILLTNVSVFLIVYFRRDLQLSFERFLERNL